MSSGLITAVLLVAFLGITAWAWSSRNRERFRDAAQLPLNDEVARDGCCGKEKCT
ncbi:cbb3-type cytochrome c oxidase subunit 3 [Fontimonas sp. SYSU GA230001]|uniref:cbb3-type cytochrome oxidase subunit 3 n=1 Tax=Fontimonas sp. SYSU GA230001 TaxID=3142450 RepID=UPI0032B44118